MKFNAADYKDKKVVMHCKTRAEANNFCNVLDAEGLRWCGGDRYIFDSNWDTYKNNTIYFFKEGAYGDLMNAIVDGYKVLEWEDFMNKEFTKADLRNGDICVTREGNAYIAIPDINCLKSDNGSRYLNDTYNNDLTCKNNYVEDNYEKDDIVDVYRPNEPHNCSFNVMFYKHGEHVYHRDDKLRLTISDIAEKYGVDAADIMIVDK